MATSFTKNKAASRSFAPDGNENTTGWVKYTIDYTDFQPEAGASKTINILPSPDALPIIPASGLVTGVKLKHSSQFLGNAGMTSIIAEVRDSSNGAYGLVDVFTVPSNINGAHYTGGQQSSVPNHVAASNLTVTLTVDAGTIDELTQGEFDVWVKLEKVT